MIKLKLKRIDPVKYATIIGVIMALMTLIFMVPMMLLFSAVGAEGMASDEFGMGAAIMGGGIFMAIIMPIIYGVFGFIAGLLSTMLLNFVLKKMGGLDLDFEKAGMEMSVQSKGITEL